MGRNSIRINKTNQLIVLFLSMLLNSSVFAQSLKQPALKTESGNEGISKEIEGIIYARIRESGSNLTVSNLRRSPIQGIYKIDINEQLAFVSKNGKFLISGEMYQVFPDRLVNLQEKERLQKEQVYALKRAKQLVAIDKEDMVIYSPKKKTKGHVYVFTDIDCAYCRQLHSRMKEMLSKGIEVRYLAFPRAGIDSYSAQKLETTWCAEDPRIVMTRFKRGENIALDVCTDNPVKDHYLLGQEMGVRGTPAIVLESGKLIPGAISPEILAKEMGI